MPKARSLSPGTVTGLYLMQKYRFLTVGQFARIAGFSTYHAAEVLRDLTRWGFIGFFGYIGIPSQGGKTPKVYYLKRKGWDILSLEQHPLADALEPFMQVHTTWTPQMYHRIRTIDLLISAEAAISKRPHLAMAKTFVSYRMIKKGHAVTRETTDFVAEEKTSENKLVPDAAFVLENVEMERRALFFVEMDMATERIISQTPHNHHTSLHYKISQYDRYLKSLRYSQTYSAYGQFRSFTLLFVTLSDERVQSIRRQLRDLPEEFAPYYRFTSYEHAMGDFFGPIWKSRLFSDHREYALVREKQSS